MIAARALVVIVLAACGGTAAPPLSPKAALAQRLDGLHEIARRAMKVPAVRAPLPLARSIARPTDDRSKDEWMLADQAWLASPTFDTSAAPQATPRGDGPTRLDAAARGPGPLTGDAEQGAAALAGMRWVAVVRVREHEATRIAGDVLIFDAATRELIGGFPFDVTAADPATTRPEDLPFELEPRLERDALTYASGR